MAWAKIYTLDFGPTGDTVKQGVDKLEDNVDDIYVDLNLLKTTFIGGTAPASPDTGQLWLDSSVSPAVLKQYNGATWTAISTVFVSTSSPSGPVSGQLWLDSNYTPSRLKQYNGSAWIPVVWGNMSFPEGFLVNGKFTVTVASFNLTLAIKTLAGTDPSATDPVYVRIGDTIRTISAALSVTKNAGTNWMNLGCAELATLAHDLFVYLGYNATDGVVLGFARFPDMVKYSDFSVTTTDQKYAAISTITNAAATDVYVNIGRFAAISSGTASFNWSLPSPAENIQHPIFYTKKRNYNPVDAGFTGVTVGDCWYQINNGLVFIEMKYTGTSNATNFLLTVPVIPARYSVHAIMVEDNTTVSATPGKMVVDDTGVATLYTNWSTGAWTNSGTKSLYLPVAFTVAY